MRYFVVFVILLYQLILSSFIKLLAGSSNTCRFSPSCSEYTKEVIVRFGILAGVWLGMKRISRCSPFGNFGYDRNF